MPPIFFFLFKVPLTHLDRLYACSLKFQQDYTCSQTKSEEFNAMTACRSNLATFPGTSTAQAVAADDWVEKQPKAIPESFYLPDQRAFQQDMEDGASTSWSQNSKKLGKSRISESNAEHGTHIYVHLF